MLYITQLIFIEPEKETTFLEFEETVLPLMANYDGKLLYRVRPTKEAFLHSDGEQPYEIHVISFPSKEQLKEYLMDETRKQFLHLKEASIKSSITIQGELM